MSSVSCIAGVTDEFEAMSEVVAAGEGVGVVDTEDALTVDEGLFVQGNSGFGSPRRLETDSEVVAAGERVGVVDTENALTVGEGLFKKGQRCFG